jgi:multisubunit Na+/H+ antiporter MnhC subunit
MVPLNSYLILSGILFAIGTAGVFLRRNLITVLLSIEIMLNAVNLSFVAIGRYLGSVDGHDEERGRGRGRPGAGHRAVPAPRDAQP